MDVDTAINHMQALDVNASRYADVVEVLSVLTRKAAEFDAKSKKLKAEKERIKEIVRLRMIKEGSASVNTEYGTIAPKSSDHIVMNDFDQFKIWLREGVTKDVSYELTSRGIMTADIACIIREYACGELLNDRLHYLKQSCFDSKALKALHTSKEDSLPPGIGIYVKKELSITKIKLPK